MGAHWRRLANTIEQPVCGGDAALCYITLTTCFLHRHKVRRRGLLLPIE